MCGQPDKITEEMPWDHHRHLDNLEKVYDLMEGLTLKHKKNITILDDENNYGPSEIYVEGRIKTDHFIICWNDYSNSTDFL